jgi:hypothetical protein
VPREIKQLWLHPWVTNANVSNEHIVDAHTVIRQRYLERRNKAKR